MKTTKEIVHEYFNALAGNSGWDLWVTDDIAFKGPTGTVKGKEEFVQMTGQFSRLVTNATILSVIAEGERASVTALYQLMARSGERFDLETAEFIEVSDQKIRSFEIFFDTARLNAFMGKIKNN